MRNVFLLFLCALLPLTSFGSMEWKKRLIEYDADPGQLDVTAAFYFVNTGDKPIEIMQTKSSCGCTVAKPDKTIYQPGEMGTIKAKFTFGERTGTQEKLIKVYTDDTEHLVENLKLIVHIPEVVIVEPKLLYWSRDETPTPKTSIITFDLDEPTEVAESPLDAGQNFVAELMPIEEGYRYSLTVVPLDTSSKDMKMIDIPVVITGNDGQKVARSVSVAAKIY